MDKIKHNTSIWQPTLPRYHPCLALLFFFLPHSSSVVSGDRGKTFSLLPPAARLLVEVLGFQERRCKISDRRFRCKLTTAPLTGSSLTGQEVCVHQAAGHGPKKAFEMWSSFNSHWGILNFYWLMLLFSKISGKRPKTLFQIFTTQTIFSSIHPYAYSFAKLCFNLGKQCLSRSWTII